MRERDRPTLVKKLRDFARLHPEFAAEAKVMADRLDEQTKAFMASGHGYQSLSIARTTANERYKAMVAAADKKKRPA